MKKQNKKWSDMTAAELRKGTKQYDVEFAADIESKPLTPTQSARVLEDPRCLFWD